jgi:hypothetical protein
MSGSGATTCELDITATLSEVSVQLPERWIRGLEILIRSGPIGQYRWFVGGKRAEINIGGRNAVPFPLKTSI